MQLINIIFQLVRGGKRGIALAGLIIVYVLQKYFGVEVSEAEVTNQILMVLGAVGVVHGAYKSETVQKIIAGIKAKKAADPAK